MFESIKQNILIILIWILTIAVLIALALFFGDKTSNPKYLSDIDKLFYDNNHQPAKVVLTITDANETRKDAVKKETLNVGQEESNEVVIANPSEIVNYIPRLENLVPAQKQDINIVTAYKASDSYKMKTWMYYSRRIDVPPRFYKVTVVLKSMGLNVSATNLILKSVNNNTSIAFATYARDLKTSILEARKLGFETYVNVPIASKDYLNMDTGPKAFNPNADQDEIKKNIADIIDIEAPIGGIILDGEVSQENTQGIIYILNFLKERGLLLVDATVGDAIDYADVEGLSKAKADIIISGALPKDMILNFFSRAEDIAKEKGSVVIVMDPKPLSIILLIDWINSFSQPLSYDEIKDGATIEKPFILVPVSSVVVE